MSKNSDYAYKTILHPELIKGLLDSHSSENGAWRLHIDEAINDNNEMLYEEFAYVSFRRFNKGGYVDYDQLMKVAQ
eukprot:scaffold84_cov43-Tisochrysis_lutea.AAC.1